MGTVTLQKVSMTFPKREKERKNMGTKGEFPGTKGENILQVTLISILH
jgi:hypothetical protein